MTEVEANLKGYEDYIAVDYDDAEWDRVWTGLYSILCGFKTSVKEAFGLNPKASILEREYPSLLKAACDPQLPLVYRPDIREFGLIVFNGGPSYQQMYFDPWSGQPLPKTLRDKWFETVEQLGIHPIDDRNAIPARLKDETWWKESHVSGKNS
jgi:hypothetical protein